MSPTRRKTRAILLGVAALAVVAGATYVVGPRLAGGTTKDASSGSAAATSTASASAAGSAAEGSGRAVEAATSTAPYTIKAEPSKVATDAPLPTEGGPVTVTMTQAAFDRASGTVQVYGFVAGVLEDGGTCTLTLTHGSDKVTATAEGLADATNTSCGLVQSPAGLAAGTWEAVLAYSSHDAHGTSRSVEVTVR